MKTLLKSLLRGMCREYQLNRVYFVELPAPGAQSDERLGDRAAIRSLQSPDQVAAATDDRVRERGWYLQEHAHAYGIYERDDLVAICTFWTAGHPRMPQRFAALHEKEAVMVDLLTAARCRGKGYALILTRYAAADLHRKGYSKLWTWVWHSNTQSIRVFDKAGWTYSHFLAEFRCSGMKNFLTIRLPCLGS